MTNKQEKALEALKKEFFKTFSFGHPEEYEFKEDCCLIQEWSDGTLWVYLEMGMIGDEGTLAETCARDDTHCCIGKLGGYFIYRERTHTKARLSLHEAVWWGFKCEQIRKKNRNKKEA